MVTMVFMLNIVDYIMYIKKIQKSNKYLYNKTIICVYKYCTVLIKLVNNIF